MSLSTETIDSPEVESGSLMWAESGQEQVWFSCWIRLSFWARDQRGREESLDPDRQPASPGRPQQHGLLWPSFSFSPSHLFLPCEEERALPFIFSSFLPSGAWQKIAQAENGTPLAYQKTHMLDRLCQKVLDQDVQVWSRTWPDITRTRGKPSTPSHQKCWPHRRRTKQQTALIHGCGPKVRKQRSRGSQYISRSLWLPA